MLLAKDTEQYVPAKWNVFRRQDCWIWSQQTTTHNEIYIVSLQRGLKPPPQPRNSAMLVSYIELTHATWKRKKLRVKPYLGCLAGLHAMVARQNCSVSVRLNTIPEFILFSLEKNPINNCIVYAHGFRDIFLVLI